MKFSIISSYLFTYILRYCDQSCAMSGNVWEINIFNKHVFSSGKNISLLSFLISRVASACFKENVVMYNAGYIFRSSELCHEYASISATTMHKCYYCRSLRKSVWRNLAVTKSSSVIKMWSTDFSIHIIRRIENSISNYKLVRKNYALKYINFS